MIKKSSLLFFILINTISLHAGYFQKLPDYDAQASCLEIQNKISIQAQYFSRQDSIHYFKKDLIQMGYRPILVTLLNTGSNDYLFKKNHFQLPLVSTRKIIKELSFGSSPFASSLLLSAFRTRSISFMNIAACIATYYYNKEVENGFEVNRLQKNRVYKLAPYQHITFLLFVEEEKFSPQFDVYFFDTALQKNEKVSVDLLKGIKKTHLFVPDECIFD